MTDHILIVDSMEAFATILKEGIEGGGDYQAEIVTTALEARNVAARGHLSLAIVDLGLQDEDAVELLKTLRERHPDLRLMVIPVGDVPADVLDLGIQGTLPKPFFLPEVPAQIENALGRGGPAPQVEEEPVVAVVAEPVAEAGPKPPSGRVREKPTPEPLPFVASDQVRTHLANEASRLTDHLRYLSRELNADAVLLTYGAELVAYAGHFVRADAERLAQVVSESWQASVRVAAALGREKVRFEQSLHEGQDYLLYSLTAAENIVLSVALRADRPLGMIRYNTKQTAQDLQPLLRLR